MLTDCLASAASDVPFKLNVLQGSRARALYERCGFVVDTQDAVDVFMTRSPGSLLPN